jgi:hypothetical protein
MPALPSCLCLGHEHACKVANGNVHRMQGAGASCPTAVLVPAQNELLPVVIASVHATMTWGLSVCV